MHNIKLATPIIIFKCTVQWHQWNILYSFCTVAVANYHKCSLKQQKVFSHSQGGQKSEIIFTTLKSRICQDCMLLGALIKESVSLLLKISSGHLFSLSSDPFLHIQNKSLLCLFHICLHTDDSIQMFYTDS